MSATILEHVKEACIEALQCLPSGHVKQLTTKNVVDNDWFCVSNGLGAPTLSIATRAGMTNATCRAELIKLAARGEIIKMQKAASKITWWPVGLCDEIAKGYLQPHR